MSRFAAVLLVVLAAACASSSPPPAPSMPVPPAPVPAPAADVPGPRPDVLLSRARALRASGDVEGARARLALAFAGDPDSDDVRLELADVLVADGRDLEQARALLEGVHRRDARFELVRGRLAEVDGDDAGAASAYARALAVEDDPDVRLRRALALERLGQGDEALAELERVRSARPQDPVVRARLAERYEAAGRVADAEDELVSLAQAAPERAAGWEHLAHFYERTNQPGKARSAEARARDADGRKERALRPLRRSAR